MTYRIVIKEKFSCQRAGYIRALENHRVSIQYSVLIILSNGRPSARSLIRATPESTSGVVKHADPPETAQKPQHLDRRIYTLVCVRLGMIFSRGQIAEHWYPANLRRLTVETINSFFTTVKYKRGALRRPRASFPLLSRPRVRIEGTKTKRVSEAVVTRTSPRCQSRSSWRPLPITTR
jgi:hypothetical protein